MDKRRLRSRNNRKKIKIKKFNWNIILKFAIILCVIFISTFFSILNMGSSKIINNVYINGISVSSLSTEEARTKLEKAFNEKLEKEIEIKNDGYETSIQPAEIDFSYDIATALENAYGVGRTGNILTNNFRILCSLFTKNNIEAPIQYNSDKLDNVIDNISVEIPNLVVNPTYYIDGSNLILSKGTAGNKLDKDMAKNLIISSINESKSEISLPISYVQPDVVSVEKIHDDIYSEPVNASIAKDTYSIVVEKKGIDFANSIDEVKNLVNNSQENEISIPLVYKDADITVADLGEDIFVNTISSFSTKYDITNTNRATNLEIAVNKINGIVVAPGETFSFNKIVGERSTKAGFKEAIIYSDGELDYGVGGGICQISSNLYYSVLLANLDIVERKNHSMTVNYLPMGCDATVSYGSVDFKFKNSRNYPIRIDASINTGVITIAIKGVEETPKYNVDIVVETTQKNDFDTTYEYVSSIPEGTEVIKQTGKYGYKCSTYRVLYQSGKVVSKTLLSTDTYKPQKQIIQKHK